MITCTESHDGDNGEENHSSSHSLTPLHHYSSQVVLEKPSMDVHTLVESSWSRSRSDRHPQTSSTLGKITIYNWVRQAAKTTPLFQKPGGIFYRILLPSILLVRLVCPTENIHTDGAGPLVLGSPVLLGKQVFVAVLLCIGIMV